MREPGQFALFSGKNRVFDIGDFQMKSVVLEFFHEHDPRRVVSGWGRLVPEEIRRPGPSTGPLNGVHPKKRQWVNGPADRDKNGLDTRTHVPSIHQY
jgi:hypothetical protein